MKRTLSLAGLAASFAFGLALSGPAFAAAEDAIGTWKDADTGGITQIYACDGGICIKVVTPSKDRAVDTNNPDPALKGRSMAGAVIMQGAAKDGADRWKGKVYNSEDGKTYSGWVIVKSKDEVKLEGCVLGILCKTHTWHRTQ
ncbi:MAG: DUF2147 domain-containing protein [Rhodomicrobium sp.]